MMANRIAEKEESDLKQMNQTLIDKFVAGVRDPQ